MKRLTKRPCMNYIVDKVQKEMLVDFDSLVELGRTFRAVVTLLRGFLVLFNLLSGLILKTNL